MSTPPRAEPAAAPEAVFAAFGDATRLAIIGRLAAGEAQSIARLTTGSRLTRQAIAKHLRVLAEAGLVRRERVGRESLYSFRPEPVAAMRAYLDRVSAHWDASLARLKAFVEEG